MLGVIGSGRQARTQVEAIANVRALREVRVFSRSVENREAFCRDITARLGIAAQPVDTPQGAATGCDVVVTDRDEPALHGDGCRRAPTSMRSGRITSIAASSTSRPSHARRSSPRTTRTRCSTNSTDLAAPVKEGHLAGDKVHPLGDVVAGRVTGRTRTEDITLFKSLGVAIEDVALAVRAFERPSPRASA